MKHLRSRIAAVLLCLAFLLAPSFYGAEWDIGNYTITGEGEVGGLPRSFSGSKSKFEEYRDVPESIVVPELKLNIESKKSD